MALTYLLYNTLYDNTIIDRSDTSFAPLQPNTGEIQLDVFIPKNQPLYLYAVSGGTIIENDSQTIVDYLNSINLTPKSPNDIIIYDEFSGYSANTNILIGTKLNIDLFNQFSGVTLPANYFNKSEITTYTATTNNLIETKVNKSGDTITGNLNISGDTTFGGNLIVPQLPDGSVADDFLFWNPSTCQISSRHLSGVTGNLIMYDNNGNPSDSGVSLDQITGGTGYYVYGDSEVTQNTTSTTPVLYLTTGGTLSEGIFSLDYTAVIGNTVKNRNAYVQFYMDGSPISSVYAFQPILAGDVFPISYFKDIYITAGAHTFSIYYYAASSTAIINRAAIRVRKIN